MKADAIPGDGTRFLMNIPPAYFVRFGAMRHVGRFVPEDATLYERGDVVVVRSRRGHEIGEVIAPAEASLPANPPLIRIASAVDRDRARRAEADRERRLAEVERVFHDGEWPIDVIDVEPLLDEGRTVLLYLGPHHLDASGLFQAIRDRCGLDIVLEPVGVDASEDEPIADDHGGCGSCGEGGGCGSGCGTGDGGCSGCAVKDLVRARGEVAGASL